MAHRTSARTHQATRGAAVDRERAMAFIAGLSIARGKAERESGECPIDREALGTRIMAWLETHQDMAEWTETQVKHYSVLMDILEVQV